MNVLVVGAGSWGTTFAALLEERGHEVVVAGRHAPFVPIAEAPAADADLVCIAVPSRAFSGVAHSLPGDAPRLILTKGLDPETGGRLSQVVENAPVAVLSGPNHAEEIAQGLPAAAVLACEDEALAGELQHAIISPRFRVYVNSDLVGVELCAASKNVMALAAGAVDGLEAGDNAKAALITRGLVEMARLGEACGARQETFAGLAGMGDLVVTCWSRHSRNRRAGELIARGATAETAAAEIGQVVEGLTTAPVLRDLARSLGIELPITEAVCGVLGGQPLDPLVSGLMARKPTDE
ncbi:MAG TPA: NAD(P)H-dependent glycerol-3-phosphate dehydrogenase [Gaiellaceae bacterium]|nr:NAD(P)H-dependent glycerol-3-phosphate dehydrogenase [Gaiellaceae bacterium]